MTITRSEEGRTESMLLLKSFALILALFLSGAMSATKEPLSMVHEIKVPAKFSKGREIPMEGTSDIERYVEGYERYWWHCVKTRAKDIDAQCDLLCSGNLPATDGCSDGAEAAMKHIDRLVSRSEKKETQQYLAGFLPAMGK
jgi:hypothetical protein